MTSQSARSYWRLLGDPSITWDGCDLTPRLGKKAIALLAYLSLSPDGAGRGEIARILWPPAETTRELGRAKHSLRQCLVSVRKAFGDAYDSIFEDSDDRLRLRPDRISVDIQRLAERADGTAPGPEELADLCRGAFLRSLMTRSRPFDEWAAQQRDALGRIALAMLESAHAEAKQRGDRALAAKLDDAMLRIGYGRPYNGEADAAQGEAAPPRPPKSARWVSHIVAGIAALGIGVGAAYGLSPSFKDLIDRWIGITQPEPRLAVVPFKALGSVDDEIAFAIKQDVEHGLQLISELVAISPGPQVTGDEPGTLTSRARQIGVRYLIVGTLRGNGNQVEITFQCFDAESRTYVCSGQFQEPRDQGFNLSKHVTLRILKALNIPVSTADRTRIEQLNDTESMAAWLAAAQGLRHLIRMTGGDLQLAEDYYSDALKLDSNYCSAHRGLAWVSVLRIRLLYVRKPDEIAAERGKARAHLDSCLSDPAHARRGTTLTLQGALVFVEGNLAEALAAGEAAIAALPNSPDAHAVFGHTLTFDGQHERGLAEIERAMELSEIDPDWYHWARGRALRQAGRFVESVEELDKHWPSSEPVAVHLVELAASYAAAGRAGDAERIAGLIKFGGGWPGVDAWMEHLPISDPEVKARERRHLIDAGL